MAARILTNYMSLGHQDSPGVFVDGGGSVSLVPGAASMADSALLSNNGVNPNGEDFEIKVIYNDQLNPSLQPVWEVMVASYEIDNGVYKWNRERTIDSSNGGAAVSFNAGTNNLKIFGVTSHEQFNAVKERLEDSRIKVRPSHFDGTDVFTTSITPVEVYQHTVTPELGSNSRLRVNANIDTRMRRLNSALNTRGRTFFQYYSNTGVWSNWGISRFVGKDGNNSTPSSSTTYQYTTNLIDFPPSVRNANGDWQFRIVAEVDFADNELQIFSGDFHIDEIIR